MSWGVYTCGLAADIAERIDALAPTYPLEPEGQVQLKAAKDAAKTIIASGAVGDGEGFQVSLTGHSNPGHKPPGSPDVVSLSVTQSTAAAVQTFDANAKAALAAEQ